MEKRDYLFFLLLLLTCSLQAQVEKGFFVEVMSGYDIDISNITWNYHGFEKDIELPNGNYVKSGKMPLGLGFGYRKRWNKFGIKTSLSYEKRFLFYHHVADDKVEYVNIDNSFFYLNLDFCYFFNVKNQQFSVFAGVKSLGLQPYWNHAFSYYHSASFERKWAVDVIPLNEKYGHMVLSVHDPWEDIFFGLKGGVEYLLNDRWSFSVEYCRVTPLMTDELSSSRWGEGSTVIVWGYDLEKDERDFGYSPSLMNQINSIYFTARYMLKSRKAKKAQMKSAS